MPLNLTLVKGRKRKQDWAEEEIKLYVGPKGGLGHKIDLQNCSKLAKMVRLLYPNFVQ